jgi:hypothetical protein
LAFSSFRKSDALSFIRRFPSASDDEKGRRLFPYIVRDAKQNGRRQVVFLRKNKKSPRSNVNATAI